jgi:hypothetical protein
MKKVEYLAPEVQVIIMKSKAAILVGSDGSGEEAPGTGGAETL